MALPEELRKLTFAQYQQIRFKPDRALWHEGETKFEIALVHMGMSFDQPVTVNELSSDGTRRLVFTPDLFDYGSLKLPALKDADLGFAGFRVLYPLNEAADKGEGKGRGESKARAQSNARGEPKVQGKGKADGNARPEPKAEGKKADSKAGAKGESKADSKAVARPTPGSKAQPQGKDEVMAFLGASYFRALAERLRYGLSARGLAIDTGEASGEEFPRFVEFWINRPAPADDELIIFALLDSRRVTGAFRFVLRPGATTRVDVRARLYLRENVAKLGIAPLTSMFLYGENQPPAVNALRPEVHDSDGLSVHSSSGEWLWRPLQNPRRLLVTSFALTDPLGFGLLQRDRFFRSYEDLDARYDLRPGAWVEPQGRWGKGRVELVQIPSPDETNDNIVAYWIPDEQPAPLKPLTLDYQLLWGRETSLPMPLVRVTQTRRFMPPPGERKDKSPPDKTMLFVIDFEPDPEATIPPEANVQWTVSGGDNAEISERTLRRHEATNGWRATLRVRAIDEKRPLELRGQLNVDGAPLSEVWSYIVPPE